MMAWQVCREIYDDRHLLVSLSVKDIQRRFSGTYFGIAWGILQPSMTVFIYWTVFQFGFRSGDVGGQPFVLWFICGMVCWLFLSEAFSCASNSFLEYSYLIQKVKFNTNILPLVKVLSSLYMHLIFLAIVLLIGAGLGHFPGMKLLQLPYYMLAATMLAYALSLATSSILVFFRDLNQMIGIMLLAGMWGTPIAWDMGMFPPKIQMLLKCNPLSYLVEGYRDAILGRRWFWERPVMGIYFWTVALLAYLIGIGVYTRLRPHFAEMI